jgi:hypothetical protein
MSKMVDFDFVRQINDRQSAQPRRNDRSAIDRPIAPSSASSKAPVLAKTNERVGFC